MSDVMGCSRIQEHPRALCSMITKIIRTTCAFAVRTLGRSVHSQTRLSALRFVVPRLKKIYAEHTVAK